MLGDVPRGAGRHQPSGAAQDRQDPSRGQSRSVSTRINLVAAWHEATAYTPAERAALAVAEQLTRLTDAGIDDSVWDAAAAHHDDEQLAALVAAVAVVNACNRISIALQQPAGSYEPGAFALAAAPRSASA